MSEPRLDARVVELLREGRGPSEDARARVRARVIAAVPVGGGGGAGGGGSGADAGTRAGAGAVGARIAGSSASRGVIALVAFVAGGGAGAALYAGLQRPAPPQIVYVDRPVATALPPASAGPPAPTTAMPLAAASSSAESIDAPTPSAPRPALSGAHPSQLSAERRLLDEARAALVQGDAAGSLALLERHRRSFATPVLGEERDAMEVEALVKAGRYDEARSRAADFRKRTPDSLFLPTVESAIASIP